LSFVPVEKPARRFQSSWQKLKMIIYGWLGHPRKQDNTPKEKLGQKKGRKSAKSTVDTPKRNA
jgi:hypothetical protein